VNGTDRHGSRRCLWANHRPPAANSSMPGTPRWRATWRLQCARPGNFLDCFREQGWYLDDLVLQPVNRLQTSERRRQWREAQDSLADRIKVYNPRAIVSVLLAIKDTVEAAAKTAGSDAPLFAVPFLGNGQQTRFREAMAQIIPRLPRH